MTQFRRKSATLNPVRIIPLRHAWLVIMRAGVVLAERLTAKRAGQSSAPPKDRHIIAVINGALLIVTGGVIAAPSVQMAIGLYPEGMGIADVVINTVFSFVKCVSAAVQIVRAAGYKDPVTLELRNIGLVTAFMSMLMLETTIIAVFAHGYSMWEYVVALAVIVASSTVVMGVVSVTKNGLALTRARRGKAFAASAEDECADACAAQDNEAPAGAEAAELSAQYGDDRVVMQDKPAECANSADNGDDAAGE